MRKTLLALAILGIGISGASSLSAAPEDNITPPSAPAPGFDFEAVQESMSERSAVIQAQRSSFAELAEEVQTSIDEIRSRPWYSERDD